MVDKVVKTLHGSALACDSTCSAYQRPGHHLNVSFSHQVAEFFSKLFNTSDWPARWHCGSWTDFHGWLYILSDVSIWAAYFAIPVLLFRIIRTRKDILPFSKIIGLFIAFILLCGTTHLLDAVIFWWPAYRLSALVRLATALVSIITVFALYKMLPAILNLRTLEQLEKEIDERKKAEQHAQSQLILKQAAEDLMAKKDEFMSIASHELKTPITTVKASLQVLQRMTGKNDALQNMAPFVEKASRQVNKLTVIINDLLDVSKIQAGKLELFESEFNLMELIKECVDNVTMDNSLYVVQITGDEKIMVTADKNRIEQVLNNLLTNAIKYSPENKFISVKYEKYEDKQVKLSVTDNGIGIPGDKIDHIFDRFYRVENNSQYFSGVGLGLYISSEIIKKHSGEIGVNSVFGKGSTFWFVF